MATAVYLAALGVASGLVGLWCRRLLAELGMIHGFEAALWTTAFIATAYIASQAVFRAVVMLFKPTRAPSLNITEILSQCAALLLAPSLAGFVIPIPYTSLQRVEPLFHLAVFAAVHGVFKLMAFFAAVQGQPASRMRALPWMALAGASCLAGYAIVEEYLSVVQQERPLVVMTPAPFAIHNIYTNAGPAPENARIPLHLEKGGGGHFSLLWAPHPEDDAEQVPEIVFIAVDTYDAPIVEGEPLPTPTATLTRSLSLDDNGWTRLSFARRDFPEDTVALTASWSADEREGIKQRLGLSPPFESGRVMMLSGPWQHAAAAEGQAPGIVVLVIEALGAENMELYGYHRNTMPHLTERAANMVVYEEAYTPTPETAGACMSLLTSINPLAHRYYESYTGPLPDSVSTLAEVLRDVGYYTVAFTEGRGADTHDLHHSTGFERGFILFDDSFPLEARSSRSQDETAPTPPVPAGAWVTLQKAGDWIASHADTRYMVFIRLRELRNPVHRSRYGDGFVGQGRRPDPVDVYDTAITYVDKQVSAFLDRLHSLPEGQRPVVAITSTHGYDFTEPGRGAWRRGGPPRRTLHESALRIPLLLDIPERYGSRHKNTVSLEDVGATLAAIANGAFPHATEGTDSLRGASMRECIAMTGDPVALSMRTGRWRFSWQSGRPPYSTEQIEDPAILEFVDISRYRGNLAPVDNIRREPQLVEAFTQQLRSFLQAYQQDSAP